MNEQAGERFAGLSALEAREAVVAALRADGAIARTEPYTHAVPFSHRSGERIEPLISLQWFMKMGELAAPAIAAVRGGAPARPPREPAQALPRLARRHPALVHLAAALVGPPDPRLVPRGRDVRRHGAARGRRLGARPGRARHVVLVRPVAVRHARLAGRHARAARVLPDRRALDGPRHPLPVGRPHGDAGDRAHRRGAVHRRLQPLDDPGAGRAPDVEVARHRHRPARGDRPARRRRHALRPARDVLDPGRALLGGEGGPGPPAREQAVQRVAARAAARRARRGAPGRARRVPRRSRTRGSCRGCSARRPRPRARSRRSSSTAPRSACTTSSTASCATGTWRS